MNVYDFDKTIFMGDSTVEFYKFCLARTPRMWLRLPKLAYGALFVLKKDKQRFKQDMFAFLRDLKEPEKMVDEFWKQNINRIYLWYLKQKRDDDVIISASPKFLVKPAMQLLGGGVVLASPVNVFTGLYEGFNCHGDEKVRRYRAMYGNTPIQSFYSDSHSDDPMAFISQSAYIVRDGKLLGWLDS